MCTGRRPSPPRVVYQGPSEQEMAANRAAIESYRQASLQQQQQFADQLQQQIDRANAQMEEQRGRLQSEQQAAMAQAAAQQQGSYAVTTAQTEPVAAMTTTAVKAKTKDKASLKIAPGATAAASGAGLNIGV